MMKVWRISRTFAACILMAAPAKAAAPAFVPINPANAQIGYSVFALGLVPMRGTFQDFSGTLTLRTEIPGACQIHVRVSVGSLRMASRALTRQALATNMLDVGGYPAMEFTGACQGQGVDGTLSLHGAKRPFHLSIHRDGQTVTCSGSLMRRDYGIKGLAGWLSSNVHITLSMRLPDGA